MTGRHRSPPMLARWLPHIAVAAAVGIVGPPVWLFAATIGAEASAASAAAALAGVTLSTASRSARTAHVPATFQPAPEVTIGAEGAWDPEPTPNIALNRPVPSETFARVTGTAQVSTALTADPVANTDPLTTDQQPATQPGATEDPPPSPTTDTAAEPDEDSSDPTEETPVTETSEPTPTDVLEEIVDEAVGEGA